MNRTRHNAQGHVEEVFEGGKCLQKIKKKKIKLKYNQNTLNLQINC